MEFKKLSDFKGEEEAWGVIAELIEPLGEIAEGGEIVKKFTSDTPKAEIAKYVIKNHKSPATKILAILACVDYETFKETITPGDILIGVVSVLNDKELVDLFMSQG